MPFLPQSNLLKIAFKSLCFISCLLIAFSGFGQSKKELEKRKEQIQKDIEYTNQLLNQTRKSKTATLSQLITLNKKITYRTELINTISTEINGVDNEITGTNRQIDSLERRMTALKAYYADLLYYTYKNQS